MERVRYRKISDDEELGVDAYMKDQDQCRLCLQFFKENEELMKIPMCEHIFHIHCLKKWLIDFQKCPVCESNIVELPKEDLLGSPVMSQELKDMPGKRDFIDANNGRNILVQDVIS